MLETTLDLHDEVSALRAELAALRAAVGKKVRIEIDAGGADLLLGLPVTLDVTVRDAVSGRPLPDLTISAVAGWGDLHVVQDGRGREGSSVTARTGIDGRVRLLHLPAASRYLQPQQKAALEAALSRLDASAAAPADDRAGFDFLTRQYRWEPNAQLRGAVDAYFHYHRRELDAGGGNEGAGQRWQTIEAVVQIAVLTDGANAGGVALQVLRFKNWLPPWLQSFGQSARAAGELTQELEREKERRPEPNRLLDGIYGSVRGFVDRQYGVVGEFVGQRVAKEALRTFLTEGIADLPDQTRKALFPAVQIASATVEQDGVNVLSALTQARVDLRRDVDTRLDAIDLSAVEGLGGRVADLETSLTGKLDAGAFDAFRQQTTADLGRKLNVGTFNSFQQEVNGRFDGLVIRGEFDTFRQETNIALDGKVGAGDFDAFRGQTTAELGRKLNVGTFNSFRLEVNNRFDGLVIRSDFDSFRDEVAVSLAARVDSDTFAAFRNETDARLEAKADLQRLVAFQQETTEALNRKLDVNRFASFERDVNDRLRVLIPRNELELFQEETKRALLEKVDAAAFEGFREENALALRQKVDAATHRELSRELSTLLTNVQKLDRNVTLIRDNVNLTPGVIIRPIFP